MEQTQDSQRTAFYYLTFSGQPSQKALESFGKTLADEGIKASLTLGGMNVETLAFTIMALPKEDRDKLWESLKKVEFNIDEFGKVTRA
jgi:hypothetical protein